MFTCSQLTAPHTRLLASLCHRQFVRQALEDEEAAADNNCGRAVKFEGTYGAEFQGGHGAEYGGGGGGGYFGGGGGGTTPGLAGGGGGGSCFVQECNSNGKPVCEQVAIYRGTRHLTGGTEELHPPESTDAGDWDKNGRLVGAGGLGGSTLDELPCKGSNGGIRIYRAGFVPKSDPENRWWIGRNLRAKKR